MTLLLALEIRENWFFLTTTLILEMKYSTWQERKIQASCHALSMVYVGTTLSLYPTTKRAEAQNGDKMHNSMGTGDTLRN